MTESGSDDRRLRVRPDLQWVRREIRGQVRWIVRDPLTTDFYYFSGREKGFLDQIDGHHSIGQLMAHQPPGEHLSEAWKQRLIAQASRFNLLLGQPPGHGRQLSERRRATRRRAWRMTPFQTLAIRVPVFDPTWLLHRTHTIGRAIFSKSALAVFLLAAVCLLMIVVGRWDYIAPRIPSLQAMLTGDRVLLMVAAYLVLKGVHEFSHAVACHRWGAECHEIGVLFLAFMPCLYCDVSDVWKVPGKFPRVMVAAAGIFAELAMAIAAGFVWFITVDGPLNLIAFNLMMLGSISTILINANPLLRYDGYYILADAIEVPNLSEQSREALWSPLKSWLSAGRLATMPRDAPFALLFTYGVASLIYRMIVLVLILWGLNQVLADWGLDLVAGILTTTILLGMAISLFHHARMNMTHLLSVGPPRRGRFLILAAVVGLGLLAVFRIPIPHSVAAVGLAKPVELEPLFASSSGFLEEIQPAGSKIAGGERVATLRSPEEEYRFAALVAELAELEKEIAGLNSRVNDEPELSSSIAVLEELVSEKRKQLESARRELNMLDIAAQTSGTLIEPARRSSDADPKLQLTGWQGSSLDEENRGAWIEEGTLLGWVADLSSWKIEAFVTEADVLGIQVGASARIRADQSPGEEFSGRVVTIDLQPLDQVPQTLQGDSRLPVRREGPRTLVPEQTTYRVIIELDDAVAGLSHESLVGVRIDSAPKSLAERIRRYLRRTFREEVVF